MPSLTEYGMGMPEVGVAPNYTKKRVTEAKRKSRRVTAKNSRRVNRRK